MTDKNDIQASEAASITHGVVAYTDGSARPNPGFHGAGVHGYLYAVPTDDQKPTKVLAFVATDKGYLLPGDVERHQAKPVVVVEYFDSYAPSLFEGTNNVAEINAVSVVFEHHPELMEKASHFHLVADSRYVLDGLNGWLAGWIRNNWITSTGKPVSNQEHWRKLNQHLSAFEARATTSNRWIKGHNDDYGNVKADYLAGIATNVSTRGDATPYSKRSSPQGYHKVNVQLHPFLSFKRIYFNTDPSFNEPGTYFQTSWSGTEFILGKRTPEAAFSVVRLQAPDPVMETVISKQVQASRRFESNRVMYAKVDRLRSADVNPWLVEHGEDALYATSDYINFLDQKPMTFVARKDELPLRAIEVMNHLEELLSAFEADPDQLSSLSAKPVNYQLHDITEHFYELGEKKQGKTVVPTWTLKKDYGVGVKKTSVTLPVGDTSVELHLLFTDDIPGRNTFKNLEELAPSVKIVTWMESSQLVRYATLIKTTDAIGIWSNAFANQRFLTGGTL